MVDALLDTPRARPTAKTGSAVRAQWFNDRAEIDRAIDSIDKDTVYSGYQDPAFLRAWTRLAGCNPMFVTLSAPGHGPVLLPFEVCDNGVAGYCGGRHANGNFPVGRPGDVQALCEAGRGPVVAALKAARLPASAIVAERQHGCWQELENPLVFDDSAASPNIALSFAIDTDFETLWTTKISKSTRKKFRSYQRKLENQGTVTFHHPVPAAETARYLDAFFTMKAVRFRQAGITDVFSDERTQSFFRALFAGGGVHQLHALTLDDAIVAVIGCTVDKGRTTVEFGSFDNDYGDVRPGQLLFRSAIEYACEHGCRIFDFGIGDEPYKRRWCDIETTHYDTTIGLTLTGRMKAGTHQVRSRIVHTIKSNDRVWSAAKSLRKALHRG